MANIQILGKFKSVTEDEILADAREIEVDDERISSTPQRLTDVLAGIGGDAGAALAKTGGTMLGDINMGENKITNLDTPENDADAATKKYVDDETAKKAPINHASTTTTYGAGNATNYGHVKLSDATNGTSGVSGGTAATPAAVKAAYDIANAALPKAGGTMTGNIAMGSNKLTGLGAPSADGDAATKKYVDDNFIAATLKGANNGVAELDANGKVPAAQLPSYVDDVIEGYYYNNKFYKEDTHTTEIPGETGKIYVNLDTERTYRWGGTAYAEISASLALGETASTAYAGDKGKEAHDLASAALPKAGGTMSGDIAMGNHKITGLANGQLTTDAATVGQLTGLIKHQTATISTSATSAVINLGGGYYTCFNAYATIGNELVYVDIEVNQASGTVTFSTAQAPTSAVTCHVFYFLSPTLE